MKNPIIAASIFCLLAFASCNNSTSNTTDTKQKVDSTKTADVYICPMDSDVQSDKPGACPKCGMDLEKKSE
jgi:hypothetical protein